MEELKLKDDLSDPEKKTFLEWNNYLTNPKYRWVWCLGKSNSIEWSTQIFLAATMNLGNIYKNTDSFHTFIESNRRIFNLIKVETHELNIKNTLLFVCQRWGIIEMEFQREIYEFDGNYSNIVINPNYKLILANSSKVHLYAKSKFFSEVFDFCCRLFVYMGDYFLSDQPIIGNDDETNFLTLSTINFNTIFNINLRYSAHVFNRYITSWVPATSIEVLSKRSIDRIDFLFKDCYLMSDFISNGADFLLTNLLYSGLKKWSCWLDRNKIIASHIWKIMKKNKSRIMIPIIREYDQQLYDNLQDMNFRKWITDKMKTIKERIDDDDILSLDTQDSYIILWILSFWIFKKCGIPNWIDNCVILTDFSYGGLQNNFLSKYPKIIDLSTNEWAMYKDGSITKGNILVIIELYLKTIESEYNCALPVDTAEINLKIINKLLNYTNTDTKQPDQNKFSDFIGIKKKKKKKKKKVVVEQNYIDFTKVFENNIN